MSEPKYSIADIDNLRRVVTDRWMWGTTDRRCMRHMSRIYNETDRTKAVEELVRTHMLAGHYAADILEADRIAADDTISRQAKWEAECAVRDACAAHLAPEPTP